TSPRSSLLFFSHDPSPTEIYTLSLHDALPIYGGAHDLAVALSRVPVTEHEERARLEHREVHRDAFHDLVEVHVGAVGAGHQRADALLAVRGRADGPEEAADGDFDLADLALGHVENGHVPRPVQPPDEELVLDRRGDHHRLVLGGQRAEVGQGPAPTPIAVHRDLVEVHLQRVAGLGALDVEGAGLWVHAGQVELALGGGLHGGLEGVVGGVTRVGDDRVTGRDPRRRWVRMTVREVHGLGFVVDGL